MNNYCVITTVNKPTRAIEILHNHFGENLIIVADKKTPLDWNYNGVGTVGEWTNKLYAPDNHYARKNVGYLAAMKKGATLIYDTDDDNIPNENWKIRTENVFVSDSGNIGWYNVYTAFNKQCWPRGFSLRHINKKVLVFNAGRNSISSIQQGLADGEPDVDAIYRLTRADKIFFEEKESIKLQMMSWCPFNSQSTWWFPKAYPLMYLPVNASFRMTDIWRSFVGQRCLWEIGEGVTFHSPSEVFQDRNEHDLLKDFEDEIPGYLNNDKIVDILSELKLKSGIENICDNMRTCYQAIVDQNILPEMEMRSLNSWIKDYEAAASNLG